MYNLVYLIGRVETFTIDTEKIDIKLRVSRTYENDKKEYDNDYFDLKLYRENQGVDSLVYDNLKKAFDTKAVETNDLIAVRGRLENVADITVIMIDKISFLSTKSGKDD